MPIVSIQNLSTGMRSFQNIHRQTRTLKPGEVANMEMASPHVAMIEREMTKKDATVKLTMSDEEREMHDGEMEDIKKANRAARAGASIRLQGRAVAPNPRQPIRDTRFITDPKTVPDSVLDTKQVALDADAEADAVRKVVERAEPKKKKTEPAAEPATVEPKAKGKPKIERVALKTKKE